MNGWGAVLLAGDVVGVALTIVVMIRRSDVDGLLMMRIVGVLITGGLVAVVAFHVWYLGPVFSVILLALSVVPALTVTLSMTLLANAAPNKYARRGAVMPICLPGVAVLVCVGLWGSPEHLSAKELDTAQFGVTVVAHFTNVQTLTLTGTPEIKEVTLPYPGGNASAVPVEQYVLDGRLLTLLVEHEVICRPTVVLLHSAAGTLEVVVAAQTISVSTSEKTDPARIDATCLPRTAGNAIHTVIEVPLPASFTVSGVSDVGAYGAAVHTAKRVPSKP